MKHDNTHVDVCITLCTCSPSCAVCRLLEQKINQLTEVTAELMADLTKAVLKEGEGGPGPEGDQAGAHGKH